MIEKGLGTPGGAPAVEFLTERGAHGDRGVGLVELHPVGGHLVDMRRGAIHAPVATDAVTVDIVAEQEHEIGLGRKRGGQGEEETERIHLLYDMVYWLISLNKDQVSTKCINSIQVN